MAKPESVLEPGQEKLLRKLQDEISRRLIVIYTERIEGEPLEDYPSHFHQLGEEIVKIKQRNDFPEFVKDLLSGKFDHTDLFDDDSSVEFLREILNQISL